MFISRTPCRLFFDQGGEADPGELRISPKTPPTSVWPLEYAQRMLALLAHGPDDRL